MTGRYQVRLFDPYTGLQTALFDDWNSLYYNRRLNGVSYHTFSIDGLDARRQYFVPDAFLEVYRRDEISGVPWTLEYGGFHRTDQDQTTDRNDNLFTSYGRGYMDLLQRREVLYFAGTPNDAKSGPADDVMKAYVRENASTLATAANGRLRDGQTLGLNVALNSSQALLWAGTASWKNLLDICQEISTHGSVDFGVERSGPRTFLFETYSPRQGLDRTSGVNKTLFAPELGNMSAPYGTTSRVAEANDIIVLGPGDGVARQTAEVQDPAAQAVSPWNRIERATDSRNSTTTQQLLDVGQVQMNALRATRKLSFTVVQSLGSVYRRDYDLGDLIVATYRGITEFKKVTSVEITVANGKEDIRVHFDDEATALQ